MYTCAERIKQLRKQKSVTQAELAEVVGVKKNTVSTWERGTRKPDFEALDRLAEYFEVSFEYILGNSDDNTPRKKPTQKELNELAMQGIADDLYEEVVRLSRLNMESKRIISAAVAAAYKIDKENGTLLPEAFDITIIPKRENG